MPKKKKRLLKDKFIDLLYEHEGVSGKQTPMRIPPGHDEWMHDTLKGFPVDKEMEKPPNQGRSTERFVYLKDPAKVKPAVSRQLYDYPGTFIDKDATVKEAIYKFDDDDPEGKINYFTEKLGKEETNRILQTPARKFFSEREYTPPLEEETGATPIDTDKPIILNEDGTFSTEKTITIEKDGVYYNIPTIIGGKEVSEEEARKHFEQTGEATGAFKSIPEAEKAAQERSKKIGELRGDEAEALRKKKKQESLFKKVSDFLTPEAGAQEAPDYKDPLADLGLRTAEPETQEPEAGIELEDLGLKTVVPETSKRKASIFGQEQYEIDLYDPTIGKKIADVVPKEDLPKAMRFMEEAGKGAWYTAVSSPQSLGGITRLLGENTQDLPDIRDKEDVARVLSDPAIMNNPGGLAASLLTLGTKTAIGDIARETQADEELVKWSKNLIKENKEYIKKNWESISPESAQDLEDYEKFARNLGSGVTTLGAALGLGLATGGAGAPAALFGTYQAGNIYNEARTTWTLRDKETGELIKVPEDQLPKFFPEQIEKDQKTFKVSPEGGFEIEADNMFNDRFEVEKKPMVREKAKDLAIRTGTGEGLLEFIGLDFMLGIGWTSGIKDIALRAGSEALQEWSQEVSENVLTRGGGLRQWNKDLFAGGIFQNAGQAALIGLILGFPGGVSVSISERMGVKEYLMEEKGLTEDQARGLTKKVIEYQRNQTKEALGENIGRMIKNSQAANEIRDKLESGEITENEAEQARRDLIASFAFGTAKSFSRSAAAKQDVRKAADEAGSLDEFVKSQIPSKEDKIKIGKQEVMINPSEDKIGDISDFKQFFDAEGNRYVWPADSMLNEDRAMIHVESKRGVATSENRYEVFDNRMVDVWNFLKGQEKVDIDGQAPEQGSIVEEARQAISEGKSVDEFVADIQHPVEDFTRYGGIKGMGGYSTNKEYEIGAGTIAEAAHCILGSCGKTLKTGQVDATHIAEELNIIEKTLDEYSKDVYSKQMQSDSKYTQEAIENINKVSSELKERAQKMKETLPSDIDAGTRATAEATYDVLISLADAMSKSVEGGQFNHNAFKQSNDLRTAVEKLREVITKNDMLSYRSIEVAERKTQEELRQAYEQARQGEQRQEIQKHPGEMTREEFQAAENRGMGETWSNAVKLPDGEIVVSDSIDHGDMLDNLAFDHDIDPDQMERGWVWKGLPKEDTYVGIPDLQRNNGDFYEAYKEQYEQMQREEPEPPPVKQTPRPKKTTSGNTSRIDIFPNKNNVLSTLTNETQNAPTREQWNDKEYLKENDIPEYIDFFIGGMRARIQNNKEALKDFRKRAKKLPKTMRQKPQTRTRRYKGSQNKTMLDEVYNVTGMDNVVTDGRVLIMDPLTVPKSRQKRSDKKTTKAQIQKIIDTIGDGEEAAFHSYSLLSGDEYAGLSMEIENPIPVMQVGDTVISPKITFKKPDGKFVQYDQMRFNLIRKRARIAGIPLDELRFNISQDENALVVYDQDGNKLAILMPTETVYEGDTKGEVTSLDPADIFESYLNAQRAEHESLLIGKDNYYNNVQRQGDGQPITLDREMKDYILTELDNYQVEQALTKFARALGAEFVAEHIKGMNTTLGHYMRRGEGNGKGQFAIELTNRFNLRTLGHEIGHLLDDYLFDLNNLDLLSKNVKNWEDIASSKKKAHDILWDELKQVAMYYKPWRREASRGHTSYRHRRSELMADLGGLYLLKPEKARELAPNMTAAFEDAIANDPKAEQAIGQFREGFTPVSDQTIIDKTKNIFKTIPRPEGVTEEIPDLKGLTKRQLNNVAFLVGSPFWRAKSHPEFQGIYEAITRHAVRNPRRMIHETLEKVDFRGFFKASKAVQKHVAELIYQSNDEGVANNYLSDKNPYFTNEQLREFGATDEEIKYYRQITNAIKEARDMLIEELKVRKDYYDLPDEAKATAEEQIKAQIDKLNGYFPIRREGKIAVFGRLTNLEGDERVYYSFAKNKKEARKMENALTERGYKDITATPVKEMSPEFFKGDLGLSLAQFERFVKNMDVSDEDAAAIQRMREEFYKAKGFNENIIRREWVPGFHRTPENLIETLKRFVYSSAKRLGKTKGRKAADSVLETIDPKQQKELYTFANRYIDTYMQSDDNALSGLKTGVYMWYLAGKTSFLVQNLTQPALQTLPEMIKYVGFNEGRQIWDKAWSIFSNPSKNVIRGKVGKSFIDTDSEMKAMMMRARMEGVTSGQFTEWALGLNKPVTSKVERGLSYFGEVSEHINRTHALISGILLGRRFGYTGDQLYEFATNIVDKTQVAYGKHNLPGLVARAGTFKPAARMGLIFKNMMWNYYQWFYHSMKGDPDVKAAFEKAQQENIQDLKGRPWKGRVAAISSVFALAGIPGIPLMGYLFSIFNMIRRIRGEEPWDFEEEMRKRMPDEAADFMISGVPGLIGLDSRMMLGFGEPFPTWGSMGENLGGAAYGIYANLGEAVELFKAGRNWKAVRKLAPAAIENAMEGYEAATEGVTTSYGRKILDAEDLSGWDIFAISLGFRPMKVSKAYKASSRVREAEEWTRSAKGNFLTRWTDAVLERDNEKLIKVAQEIDMWNKTHPPHMQIKINPDTVRRNIRQKMDKTSFIRSATKKARGYASEMYKLFMPTEQRTIEDVDTGGEDVSLDDLGLKTQEPEEVDLEDLDLKTVEAE